ncbi:MAG: cysteine peptidase family C39 domain-containing protein [Planctomycetota bacterium]|jgi:hypothetical protein
MNINPLLIPTIIIAVLLFYLSRHLWIKASKPSLKGLFLLLSILLSAPAILFVIYYLHWFDNAIWFYHYRSLPLTELSAAGAGALAGIIAAVSKKRKLLSGSFILCLLILGIFIPHSKSIVFPVDYDNLNERWTNGFCLQSTNSTCGPASAATVLKHLGIEAGEKELARECYSYIGGTEIWYIARALRARDLQCRFVIYEEKPFELPYPCIAGIDIGAGHFITIIDKIGDTYIIGDPLVGRKRIKENVVFKRINFTGFFLVINQ